MAGCLGDEVDDLGMDVDPEEGVQSVHGAVRERGEVLEPNQCVRVVEHSVLCHLKEKYFSI